VKQPEHLRKPVFNPLERTESRLQGYRLSAMTRAFVHIAGVLAENAEDTAIKIV
jgi:hypothetical protein